MSSSENTPPPVNCPNCGHPLAFDPAHGKLSCAGCGQTFESGEPAEDGAQFHRHDFRAELARLDSESESAEVLTLICPGCAAEIVLPPNMTAARCPYCATPVNGAAQSSRKLRPASLLPFRITEEQARAEYDKWLKSRWFLPGAVLKESHLTGIAGNYLPFWIYDFDTHTSYTGMRGDYYYVTVSYTAQENGKTVTKTRQERRTRWWPAAGTVSNVFRNRLITATRSAPAELLDELEPWDLEALEPYGDEYIRGFQMESYSVPLADGFDTAAQRAEPEIEAAIRRDIGGDEQRIYSADVDYRDIRFRHVLLPVWLAGYRYREKNYIFTVNARTGEVQGERPWSAWKIALLAAAIALIAGGVAFFLMNR